MDGRTAELIGKIIDHLEKAGRGSMIIQYNPGTQKSMDSPPWFTNVFSTLGTSGGVVKPTRSYGTGETLEESVNENVKDFRL